jgi:hypothetical protein
MLSRPGAPDPSSARRKPGHFSVPGPSPRTPSGASRRHHLVVTQGGDEGDRFNWDVAHPSKPGGSKTVAAGYGGFPPLPVAPPAPIEWRLPTGRGTPAAPGSLRSEVGDGLQFVSALLAPANSSAGLCQASSPTSPRSLPDANCFDVLVSVSRKPFTCLTGKAQSSNPWSCHRTFGDCHNFGAYPQCLTE